jgi:hypothetical protein
VRTETLDFREEALSVAYCGGMTVLSTICGIVLILIAMNDVFQTLLHASGTGRLTHLLFRIIWGISRRRPRRVAISGTLTVLITITVWIILITLGWALIYLPHIPEGFVYSGIDPADYLPFAEAIATSLVMLTTLGLGDVAPAEPILRIVSPLEALAGFALLTASVSWFTQLYPALARRRAFAIELTSLHEAGITTRLDELTPVEACAMIRSSSQALAVVTADLVQNLELFYFTDADERLSAPRATGYAVDLRKAALASPDPDVQAEGRVLESVIDELARRLRKQYPHVRGESADDVLAHVAASHGYGWGDVER